MVGVSLLPTVLEAHFLWLSNQRLCRKATQPGQGSFHPGWVLQGQAGSWAQTICISGTAGVSWDFSELGPALSFLEGCFEDIVGWLSSTGTPWCLVSFWEADWVGIVGLLKCGLHVKNGSMHPCVSMPQSGTDLRLWTHTVFCSFESECLCVSI